MRLVIFDIDGTLTQTTAVDDACYVQAVADVFGVEGISADWSAYEHCTDVAIAAQIIRERLGRASVEDDFARLRARFVELLIEAHSRDASLYRPMPGAREALAWLRSEAGCAAAIATGGFEASARWKLATAGLAADHLPAAFAEDGPSREQVMTAALHRAQRLHQCEDFDKLVYVGDGVWDVRASASLGMPFVGIGRGERAAKLRAAGATSVLPDMADLDAFQAALDAAVAPVLATSHSLAD